jgi:CDGSH-type Zn-finger protein
MTVAVRAADTPFAVEVEEGRDYWWCACGLSQNQPFCDGSHKTTDITPVKYAAAKAAPCSSAAARLPPNSRSATAAITAEAAEVALAYFARATVSANIASASATMPGRSAGRMKPAVMARARATSKGRM